ncbi:MAG TPA: hypothetical protein VHP36_00215 [Chitinispirillaceae bacterium]|nr:hypothetical protein [Chitinispirillaceae bacterium]
MFTSPNFNRWFTIVVLTYNCTFSQEPGEYKEPLSEDIAKYFQDEQKQKKELRDNEFNSVLQKVLCKENDTTPLLTLMSNNECLLTVKEYNYRIKNIYVGKWRNYLDFYNDTMPASKNNEAKDIRKRILFSVSEQAYIREKWNEAKKERLFSDSLKNISIRAIDKLQNELSDSLLKCRYQQYYDKMFSEKNNSLFNVLCSTDSILLQKVLMLASQDSTANIDQHRYKTNPVLKPGYYTNIYHYDSLADQMKMLADSAKSGKWSKIIRMPWGFCSLFLYRYNIRKETPFKDARPQLVYLPELNDNKIIVSDKSALDFFQKNKHTFQPKDTLNLSIRIIPDLLRKDTSNQIETLLSTHRDVVTEQCNHYQLPLAVSNILLNTIALKKDSCTGWIDLSFGTWNICLIERKHGKPVCFEDYKDEIKQYLRLQWENKILSAASSVAKAKDDDRSYDLFVDNFYRNNSSKGSKTESADDLEKLIINWAEINIRAHPFFID